MEEQNVDTQPTEQTDQTEQTADQQVADLNISDLAALKSIVEIATQRGAFRANELEAVGKTFNKLEMFLQQVSQKEES
jgi:hypothetical protein